MAKHLDNAQESWNLYIRQMAKEEKLRKEKKKKDGN